MIGLFWNIRGMGSIGRVPVLVHKIRDNQLDFVGILETKKESFTPGFLKSLTGNTPFSWSVKPARNTTGGILVGVNSDLYNTSAEQILDFAICTMITDIKLVLARN
jgi:glyceraldehyde-3-phosphate dehydrogenase/erythrose-4-phosphate dehydrogenase